MSFPCPSCKATIAIKAPKPGRFTPTCPKCSVPFLLVVPDEPGDTVQVKPLPASQRPTVPFPPPKKADPGPATP